jgi:SsrA-binding protein
MARPQNQTPRALQIRVLIENRRVRHEFLLEDTFEAGLSLLGSEVKSLRAGNANLAEAWIRLDAAGAALVGSYIAPYPQANRENHEPTRERRLLLHAHELLKLQRGVRQKGMTVVPVRLYLKGSRVKLEIALAKGKKLHDKRDTLRQRDAQREMDRARRR